VVAVVLQALPVAKVPFLDLAPQHRDLKAEILGDLAHLLDSGAFTNGPAVAEFEQRFAAYCGVRRCVGVSSGLDALRLALLAAGLTAPRATASAPGRPASRPHSPSIQGKTSAPPATPAHSSRTTTGSPTSSSRSASTGSARSTGTNSRATPPGSTRCRRSCCCASCRCSTAGTES